MTLVDNPNHKGNVAELAIATEAARLGLSVLKPLTEHEPYDLAIGLDGRLLRVQCKWAGHDGDVVQVHLSRSRSNRRGNLRIFYREGEIDALAAYCADLDRCYLLPARMVVGRHMVHLRTSPARNNQRAAINFAAEYELGAVAQGKSDALAARRSRVRIPPAPLDGGSDLEAAAGNGFPGLDASSAWIASTPDSLSMCAEPRLEKRLS
jgi:PD-(D/E)XK endonuclease